MVTVTVRREGAVLLAEIAAPPMNLLGPELVRDLVSLIQRAETDEAVKVLVFKSADPDYRPDRGSRARRRQRIRAGAELAERYGWINRALPAQALNTFVSALAHRIARFPGAGLATVKERVNAIALAPVDDFRRDSDLFAEGVRTPEYQRRFEAALKRGFQTRSAELDLARLLGDLD